MLRSTAHPWHGVSAGAGAPEVVTVLDTVDDYALSGDGARLWIQASGGFVAVDGG